MELEIDPSETVPGNPGAPAISVTPLIKIEQIIETGCAEKGYTFEKESIYSDKIADVKYNLEEQ
jgi:hypothetical protein